MDGFGAAESAETIMARLARRGLGGQGSQGNGCYSIQSVIGNGAYGTVYRALDRRNNNRVVALKEVKVQSTDEGVPLSTLREISTLKQLDAYDHPNIVKLFDVYPSGGESGQVLETRITLVFEFVDQDLSVFLEKLNGKNLPESQIKDMCKQMLCGLDFLHTNRICHRDLKPQNVLVSKSGQLKLADFGLSRAYLGQVALTSVVVTLWYRSPEVLLQGLYATPVDVWSLGCIFAELYMRRALFCGQSEIDQLHKIFEVMGTPESFEWPRNVLIPVTSFPRKARRPLCEVIRSLSAAGQQLLEEMLVFTPGDRISAREALDHHYFTGAADTSECEPSDESQGEIYTDEESDASLNEPRFNASRVLDLNETSNELELSTDHLIATRESPREGPNILRGSAEKRRRSNEKKRESSESNISLQNEIAGYDVLNTPVVPKRQLSEVEVNWSENGRDFVDGSAGRKAEETGTSESGPNTSQESSDIIGVLEAGAELHEIGISEVVVQCDEVVLESENAIEIEHVLHEEEVVEFEPVIPEHITSIETLLAAAEQSEERARLSRKVEDAVDQSNITQPLDQSDSRMVRSSDEQDVVDSLLKFSSGLPNCEETDDDSLAHSLNASSTLDSSIELSATDVVDGEVTSRFMPKFTTMSEQIVLNNVSSVPANQIASSTFSQSESEITPPSSFGGNISSPEMDDNSNIVDRKRKFDADDVYVQAAKRRKV